MGHLGLAADDTAECVEIGCLERCRVRVWGISLYDLEDRSRMQTLATVTSGGEVFLPISDVLESGAYVYRLKADAGYVSGKVVVQR